MPITPRIATPCRRLPSIVPRVRVRATGVTRIRKISRKLVYELGFSNGCAELALKKPPPLLPSSLMASWLATGPPVRTCEWPASVCIVVSVKLWTTPPATSRIAATNAIGRRMRIVPRVRSTQKFPSDPLRERTKPRMSATATAMPTAAERKFWTARPTIWAVKPSRRLTGVGLPVRVGHEGHRGVEGHPERDARQVAVHRQCGLAELDPHQDHDAHEAEADDAGRVGPRALLRVGVDAAEAVDEALDAQVRGARVDPSHVVAVGDVHGSEERHQEGDREETAEGVRH